METQHAAKLILSTPEGIVLVKNPKDNLNLPGGGLDPGESALEALDREIDEELGFVLSEATVSPVYVGDHKFVGLDSNNHPVRRHWHVFASRTEFNAEDFMCESSDRIAVALRREQVYTNKAVRQSARDAIAMAFCATQSLRQSPALADRRIRWE